MTPDQARRLALVGKAIPKKWKDEMVKMDYKHKELRDRTIAALAREGVPDQVKRTMWQQLDSGQLDKKVEIYDNKREKQMEKIIETKIESMIKKGELPDPAKERAAFEASRKK